MLFWCTVIVAVALVIGAAWVAVLAGTLIYQTGVNRPAYVPMILKENATILQVSLSNTKPYVLSVDVKSLCDENIDFASAIIKDANRNLVFPIITQVTPKELQPNAEITATLNLSTNITSGTYTATLITTRGRSFISPSFKIP